MSNPYLTFVGLPVLKRLGLSSKLFHWMLEEVVICSKSNKIVYQSIVIQYVCNLLKLVLVCNYLYLIFGWPKRIVDNQ